MRRDRSGVAAFPQVNLLWNGGSRLMSGIAVALPEADRPLSFPSRTFPKFDRFREWNALTVPTAVHNQVLPETRFRPMRPQTLNRMSRDRAVCHLLLVFAKMQL